MLIDAIRRGLEFAATDYVGIAQRNPSDVKPKEDQIKCALYRALSEEGYLVQAEAGYSRNGDRCDLIAFQQDDQVAIEIKTAWAGRGWVNKPDEQAGSWARDIGKLQTLAEEGIIKTGYFILCLAYEHGCPAEEKVRRRIEELSGEDLLRIAPVTLETWNGLNRVEFFVRRIFG